MKCDGVGSERSLGASASQGPTLTVERGARSRIRKLYERCATSRSQAFTLVEVLVALCVFAMAAVVLGASYLNVLTSYEVVARGTQVNEDFGFAREQVLREPDRKKLDQGGEFETTGGRRAKWSVEITSTNVPEVFNVAFTCEISGSTGADTVKQTQVFSVLRPTWVTDVPERDKLKEELKARIYELQGKKSQ